MAKRIEFHKHGGPDVLITVEFIPVAPNENEVQVENKYIGINYIDIYTRRGLYSPPSLPSGLGTEASGIVIKVGSNVKDIKEGDRVVYAQSSLGAYSSIHNVSADKVVILPNTISFEQAAAIFLKGLTVYYLLHKTYKIKLNEPFLFYAAAGGVGLIACQWAKALGARLIGIVSNAHKAQCALQSGAWQVINYREENIVERVKEITNGKKLRVVYDSVGKDTWEDSLNCLQNRGLMVSFGNTSGPVTGINLNLFNQKGSIYVTRPSLQDYITNREELIEASDELFSLITRGIIKVNVAETQKYPLTDVQHAHKALESRETQGSSLLIPTSSFSKGYLI